MKIPNFLGNLIPGRTAVPGPPVIKSIKNPKWIFLLDPGHGGMINGKYVTAGKRSPIFPDGSCLYEGVNNRDNVKRILAQAHKIGLQAIDIVNSESDITLGERVRRANLHGRKAVYISIHSDAAGDGVKWHPAKGITVFTSIGQTTSDKFADIVFKKLRSHLPTMNMRECNVDGDHDKEADFFVLKHTIMPAILLELGFHTNQAEATYIQTEDFKTKMVQAIVDSMVEWELTMS